ncbi:hypothetical protein DICPUDRAFT_58938 [Dictyostelium purpureum]|uniref:Peptidase M48 domain-containing protein n=1 Tax=Dictyostelium purpureum TaxID=5786 RepID=F1A3L5_DICPU|nr:uncharacterized protein DICPUDRAFT_58938 [Dictyostelium purpureum]EGC29215.1 hypothetical protein DICPUDRAFT_58938 [Dictyostelium purpureum]|eukprot:XP_003294261.1 hypothetical protein DICPUDRAFT_58938 [Dictyostelium purpureum]
MTGIRSSLSKHNLFKRLGMIFLILASATGTYLILNQDEVPITGRSRLVSYSKEEEHELGQMGYDEMTKEYSPYFLPENNQVQNRVREIAKRIIDVTGRRDLQWECHVVNSETVNACVLPNGKIFIFSGLFEICESEDELASVLSHEIGHAVARHAAERLSISKLGYLFLTLTRGLIGETITGNLTTLFSTNLLNLRYNRIQEIEADLIGLEFMAKANYNPYAALSIQKKLQKYENSIKDTSTSISTLDFLSTHPAPEERILKIENWLNQNSSKFNFKNNQTIEKNKLGNENLANTVSKNSANVNSLSSTTRLSYLSQK